jgi:hypothetical protein
MNTRRMSLLVIAAVVVFLALTFKPVVEGDGAGYFSYLHSIVIDRDLDMSNEYAAAARAGVHVAGETKTRTQTGLPPNQFPIGPAILSLPTYLAALVTRPGGEPQFGPPFTTAFTLASLAYGALALAIVFRLLRRLAVSVEASLAAIAAVALGTPLLYYLVYDPSYSHSFSAFMVSAFIYLWWTRRGERTVAGWLLLGFVGGLMALVRWQDGPLIAVALLDVRKETWRLLLMAPAALAAFAPQIVVDEVIFGRWQPGAAAATFDPLHGHYLQVLFSSFHGLFVWSPVLLAAVAGYWFVKQQELKAAFALCFAITLAIIGPFVFWWGGSSFGMRFFINLTPFFAIGLGAVAVKLPRFVTWAGVGACAIWNLLLVLNFWFVIGASADPGYVGLVAGQLRGLRYLPHLAQGFVVRGLLAGNVPGALAVLALEALIVVAAVWLATAGRGTVPTAAH